MAIFGSKKRDDNESVEIQSKVVETENVAKELVGLATTLKVDVSVLDFHLLEMHTFTRHKTDANGSMWQESSDAHVDLGKSDVLLDPNFEIKQSYEIEILKAKHDPVFGNFVCSVGANTTLCKVYLSVKEGSSLRYCDDFENLFLEFINKKKLRANIMIGVFDTMVEDLISKISAKLRVDETIEVGKNEKFLIAEGIEPIKTIDDAMVMHFEHKHRASANHVDYSKRDFIISVQKDELLMEYIKPKKGSPGRDCRGVFLPVIEPKVTQEPTFKVSEDIAVIDTETSKEYRAKKSGYIVFENDMYEIKEALDIDEISFRSTGSIVTDLDSDVTLNVKESDVFKDAIGAGMNVEVSEIEVEGNIGPKATIVAKKAKIDGQTHGTSCVKADTLRINIHRGMAEGVDVTIARLEQGTVNGKHVVITQALSGVINAETVVVEMLGSHVTIRASKSIEIKKMQGSENKLIIDPLAMKSAYEDIGQKDAALNNLNNEIRDTKKEIQKYEHLVKSNEQAYLEIKKRLTHYKKNNIKMPSSFVKQYKQFTQVIERLKTLENSLVTLIADKEKLNMAIDAMQEHIFEARIINRDQWVGYNELKFKLIDPAIEVTFAPQEGSAEMVFGLDRDENERYSIKGKSE